MSYTENEKILPRNVEEEMKESYLRYSMSVIISRALPDVRDGLKPSQRRILYAMKQLNLSPGAKHRKCAKISGDTSGDYHPHGETVIYPTLVRMAQDWNMRYTLVDGQGNFGSIDGDPPAAMRYTEARLTHAAMQLMEDLDKETVDVVPNYDETKTEPVVFPSKFPNLLCNGSSGIAVGMATNIPPHNLNELIEATLLFLEDEKVSIEQIMKVMPAPDFPTGGVICGYRGIKEAFHTGRGKLLLRGVMKVEEKPNGRQCLAISEIPYGINKSRLIERMAELVNDKIITGISDIRDDSDKDGLKIILELKRGEIPDVIINQLYKFSDMQVTFGCNMLALDKGLPRIMNVKNMISSWVDHRIEIIRRRTRFELNKAQGRSHILEGYLKALDHLDEVVRIIRACKNRESARTEIMSRYSFTERQANAVLDLRLYQLTSMERDKIDKEYQDLLAKITHLKAILASEEMVKDIIRDELSQIQKNHKSPRRTKVIAAESEFNMEDLIADEQVVIAITDDDYIKRMPTSAFREQRRGGLGVIGIEMKRETDVLKSIYVASTHDYLMIFTSLGKCYWLKVWQIPEAGRRTKGRPLINYIESLQKDEKISTILKVRSFEEEGTYILLSTLKGVVKKTVVSLYGNIRKKGVNAINVDEGDKLISAHLVHDNDQIMLFTRNGMAVRFDEGLVRAVGRVARGVKGVTLKDPRDYVVSTVVVKGTETILVVCENGFGKRSRVDTFRQTNRGGKGVRSILTSKRNGLVVGALSVQDEDGVFLMSQSGQSLRMRMKDLRVMGRSTQGVKLVALKANDNLIDMQKIELVEPTIKEE
ncbi:MAG TPA: DNA topoisomerase (ATP-hydrolyzing) subunit A [Chlamydiae bacterium]|nr:DNA gyrase subunit A [Candidatus Anoxychlamydiales bacterium]HEU63978.1 DNA topoisomerase (ATP-hydrolyzing) subunit A [Chlamydiota bacterium]